MEKDDFVLVTIIDDDEGDGSVIFRGWDTIQKVNSYGYLELFDSGLIAKPEEVEMRFKIKEPNDF